MGREFRIRCAKCHHWLANASGESFTVELKCGKCAAVACVKVTAGTMTVETEWGRKTSPVEKVA